MELHSAKVACPYCGERIELLLEPLTSDQEYFEDCQVCCQPIMVRICAYDEAETLQFHCLRADETG